MVVRLYDACLFGTWILCSTRTSENEKCEGEVGLIIHLRGR